MEQNNYSVYIHKFPNGKTYVGLTKQSPQDRWGVNGANYKKQRVYKYILEFGWNNIEHIIVKDKLSESEAAELEKELIIKYDSVNNGYNITYGGETSGGTALFYEYKGNEYTIYELAEISDTGISPHGIQTRLRRGYSVEEAVETPVTEKTMFREYQGNLYTVAELTDKFAIEGLNPRDVITRIQHGWDLERALKQPKGKKKQPFGIKEQTYEYNGRLYNSYELSQIHPELGLKSVDITTRVNFYHWDIERAITQPKKKRGIIFEYNGEKYTSHELAQICIDKKITYHDVTDRARNNWSTWEIVNIPKGITKKQFYSE